MKKDKKCRLPVFISYSYKSILWVCYLLTFAAFRCSQPLYWQVTSLWVRVKWWVWDWIRFILTESDGTRWFHFLMFQIYLCIIHLPEALLRGIVAIFRLEKRRDYLRNAIFVQHQKEEEEKNVNEKPLRKKIDSGTQTRSHQAPAKWILFHSKGQIIASQRPYEGTPKQQLLKG